MLPERPSQRPAEIDHRSVFEKQLSSCRGLPGPLQVKVDHESKGPPSGIEVLRDLSQRLHCTAVEETESIISQRLVDRE
jgi:hypothetical protein